MENISFFDNKDAEIKRRRRMAEQMMQQAAPKQTDVVSGYAVKQSPLESLARAIQGGMGQYQESKADQIEQDQSIQRSKLLAQAMGAYGQDPSAAAQILMSDPSLADVGFKMSMGAIDAQREAASKEAEWQREADLKRELAALRAGGGSLTPQMNPETGEYEMVQSNAPRKLSATEQKNFYEQKAKTDSVRNALGVLDQVDAIKTEPRFSGVASSTLAFLNRVPAVGSFIDDKSAANTTTMDNLLKELAYSRLQSTFPGAISNSERESLEKLQALSSYSLPEQDKIIQEARKVLQRQGEISSQMQNGIVTGDVYQSDPLAPISPASAQKNTNRDDIVQKLKARGRDDKYIQQFLQQNGL